MYTSIYQNEERFGYSARGTFKAPKESESIRVILAIVILFTVLGALYVVNYEEIMALYRIDKKMSHVPFFGLAYMVAVIVLVIVTITYICVMLKGHEYFYSANEATFSFGSKKGGIRKTDIHYNDVVAVGYEKHKLFGIFDRGLTVTIITRSLGNVTVNYLFPKGTTNKTPENTPFHIIEERLEIYLKKTEKT